MFFRNSKATKQTKVLRTVRRGRLVDFEALESRRLLATVDWIASGGGDWNYGANWSTGNVPGPNDNAVINLPGSPQILIDNAPATVQSVTSTDPISISSNGSLTVSSSSTISGGLTMTGGSITATGSGTNFTVSGPTSISGGQFYAQNGGDLSFENLSQFTVPPGGISVVFISSGSGSQINLPALESIDATANNVHMIFTSSSGGSINASSLTELNFNTQTGSQINIGADGSNSVIDFPALTSLIGADVFGNDSVYQSIGINIATGGDFIAPHVVSLQGTDFSIDGSNDSFLNQLTSFTDGVLTIDGGSWTLNSLSDITGSGISVSSGGSLSAPAVTSYSNPTYFGNPYYGAASFSVDGSGSSLILSNLSTVNNINNNLTFQATDGGSLSAPALTSLNDPANDVLITIGSLGANSSIDMSGLVDLSGIFTSLPYPPVNQYNIHISNSATSTIDFSSLSSMNGVSATFHGSANENLGDWSELTNSSVSISGGSYTFASFANLNGSSLTISSSAMLNLPNLVTFATSNGIPPSLEADGAGSILSLSSLNLIVVSNDSLNFTAYSGGSIDLPALTTIDDLNPNSSISFNATGTNSVVNLPSLKTFEASGVPNANDLNAPFIGSSGGLMMFDGGSISAPQLTITKGVLLSIGSGTFSADSLTTMTDSEISLTSGSYTLNTISNIDGTSINLTGGSTLSLPNVTSATYSSTSNASNQLFSGASIEVTGAGSTLILSSLQSITGEQALAIAVSNGGSIEAQALTSATGVEVSLDSANVVDFNSLTTFTYGEFQLQTGTLQLNSLANIDNSTFNTSQGGVLTLPAVTTYLNSTSNFIYLSTYGAGSILSLPNLASIGSSTFAIPINAYSGGHTLLPGLKTIDLTNPSITDAVIVLSTGANSFVDLSGLVNFIGSNNDSTAPSAVNIFSAITYTNGGVVLDPNLTTIENVNITTDPTAVLTIPPSQSVSYSINTGTLITGSVNVQGSLGVQNGGYLGVLAPVAIANSGSLNVAPGGTIYFYGNLLGSPQSPSDFQPLGTVDLIDSSASPAAPQLLEAMSADLGAVPAGFVHNYAYGTLNLWSDSSVELVDQTHNTNTTTPEAVYANELIVPQGATLNLNGLHLYVRGAQIAGTVVGGSVTIVPVTNAITPGTPAFGGLSIPGSVDSWTFTGTAGESIAAALNPGGGGPIPAFPPRLDFGQIELVDSSGTVLATASSATAGSTALINGFTLPSTGTYTIDVQASTAAPASTGNYVLSVYNVTPVVAPLALNAPVSGTIDNPYAVNQYVFNVPAGSHVQLQVLYRSSSDVTFNLNGPGGFVGFANLGSNSSVVELPVSGTYVLTAHGDGFYGGSYTVVLGYSQPSVARPAAVITQHVKIARIEQARIEHERFLAYERLIRIEAYDRLKAIEAYEHARPHPRFASFARPGSFPAGFAANRESKIPPGAAFDQNQKELKFLFLEHERRRASE
jgi:hypothetical protein